MRLRRQITLASCSEISRPAARASAGTCTHGEGLRRGAAARGCSSALQGSVVQAGLVGEHRARVRHIKPSSHLPHIIGLLMKCICALMPSHSQEGGPSPKPFTFQVFKKKKSLKSIFISSSRHEKTIARPSQ